VGTGEMKVKKGDYSHLQFFVKLKKEDVTNWKTEVRIGVYEGDKKIKTIKAKFIGPEKYN